MYQQKRRKKYSKRKQQVRRQLLVIAGVLLMIIVALVSCQIQRHKKEAEVKETTKITQQEKEEKETVETEAQRLERVKREAKENEYPEGVIDLLGKNKETIDFVEDYGEKKDDPSADTIGDDLEAGEIPQLIQWDERWGYAPYGTSIVAVSGCGPTCLSMVAAGLNEDPSITPAKVAAYGTENSYVDENNDTYWKFMSEAGANWNLSCYEGLLSEEQVSAELTAGHPIICSVGPGDFTKIGHFIVLTGYESGNVTVNDPFSQKNSDKTWVYAEIADQIKAMWIYSLKE